MFAHSLTHSRLNVTPDEITSFDFREKSVDVEKVWFSVCLWPTKIWYLGVLHNVDIVVMPISCSLWFVGAVHKKSYRPLERNQTLLSKKTRKVSCQMIQYASSRLEVEHRLDLLCIVPVGTRCLRTLARKLYVEVCCSDSSHDVNASAAAAATQCFTPTDRDVDRGRTSRSESCSLSSGKAICIYGAEEKSFSAIAYDDRPSTECLGCLSARRVPSTLFSSHRKLLNAADRLPSHLPR